MKHNFLHAVCGDSVIRLAGSQAPASQELQRALHEAPASQVSCLFLWDFIFPSKNCSDSPPFIYSFIYLLTC